MHPSIVVKVLVSSLVKLIPMMPDFPKLILGLERSSKE